MALDPTARESNLRDSLKKYFVDNIYTGHSIELTFDRGIQAPKIQGSPSETDRWVGVVVGPLDRGTLGEFTITVFCCTRKDSEGFRLAQLTDTVMDYLSDTDQTDGMRRIPFYRSRPAPASWTLLGQLMVQDVMESGQLEAEDGTKYKALTCRLRWAAKI